MVGIYLLSIIIIPLVTLVVILLVAAWAFTSRVRVRDPTNNKAYVLDFWMFSKKDRTGSRWWHSVPWQKKLKFPEPPSDCIDIGKSGRKYVEVYKLSDDEYCYIQDTGFNKELKNVWKPFNLIQRDVIVGQFAKAEAKKKKNFLSPEFVLPMTAILALVVLITMLMIFWGDIAKPALETQSWVSDTLDKQARIVQEMNAQCSIGGSQKVEAQATGNIPITPDEVPPEVEGAG